MKTYYVYIWTEKNGQRESIGQYKTTDARRVLEDVKGCRRYGIHAHVITCSRTAANV